MKLLPVINQIKLTAAATFGTRVAGAVQFAAAVEQADLPVPHAFVIWLGDAPSEDQSGDTVVQMVADEIAVVVAVDNTADPRGQAAYEQLEDIKAVLLAGLLGWRPTADHGQMAYLGSLHLGMDRARLWHQYGFKADIIIQSS